MRFLVESSLNVQPTPELMALIPAETARGLELDTQGLRECLYLAADMSRAWQVFLADSPQAVEELLQSFPLAAYTASTITALAEPQAG
jgi:muconolactone delta-isomerase